MVDPEFESRVERFERLWDHPGRPSIENHLTGPFGPGSPRRGRLLAELIRVDLEYRWRDAGLAEPTSLRGYVERFPELIAVDRLPIDLIGESYRVRRRWGDRPSHAAFLAAFAERSEAIREELARVDAEIEAEADLPTPPESESADDRLGVPTLSDRDYMLERWIGAGRFGKVYEARPRAGGPDVAVKFLRKSLLGHPGAVRRFLGEARTVAGLRHPNIVATEGLGRTKAGSYFLVMERLAGPDLAAHLGGRRVAEAEAVGWMLDLCDALEHAHGRGVVHCDLKPANLVLDGPGRIKVTDFGLARSLADDPVGPAAIEGTAPFMAPEQVCRTWGPIDRRTDIHGLGAVLFTLLTGRPPVVGPSLADVLNAVVSPEPVISPARLRPDLSPPLVAVCLRCLAKPPAARYHDVGEVRSALRDLRP